MRNKIIFVLVVLGALGAGVSAYVYAVPSKTLPPAFDPAHNPYGNGIYANGIVESFQEHGENTNIYPEVAGTVTQIEVAEGQRVRAGDVLAALDASVQRAIVDQQRAQADAAAAMLDELRAQPRHENLAVAKAQLDLATAQLKTARDQLDKQRRSYEIAPESVSRDALDNAVNAEHVAQANLDVVTRQYELTRAGAWVYDVRNEERQHEALVRATAASSALLAKYTIRAPADGIVMSINTTVGSYVSPQGTYDTYTQGMGPVVVMSGANDYLAVRCYVDEILIARLPPPATIRAEMSIRGTTTKVPLEFVRVQPYVSPKIELSNQRQEKVDLRVLPVVFRFRPPEGVRVFPGQLVDVYIGAKP
ncbi:MAG TPA: biotin/lipoyl-binding protein [Kofleriaceae bacterium]|nr:biotin/lipoyl-binding protein [Kofleriaceae bacterium]